MAVEKPVLPCGRGRETDHGGHLFGLGVPVALSEKLS